MRVSKWMAASLLVVGMLMSTMLMAESKNLADYPLRLHIFGLHQATFFHHRDQDEAEGSGRADLYENGDAHGVDFSYDCDYAVRVSFGYETYRARWKKPGKELVVLMPVFGKSGQFSTCNFNADVKDFAYVRSKGSLLSEPVTEFKAWMVQHDYDPEHGKDAPVRSGTDAPAPAAAASAAGAPR